jgi:hypothetical protein
MSRHLRGLSAVAILFLLTAPAARAQEDLVPNPYYKFWANSKPGTTAVHREQTKLSGPEGKLVPGGVDEKHITYRLIAVNNAAAVVEQVVTEEDFLGWVQAAPTRHTYPARWKKASLQRILTGGDGKAEEETLKVGGEEVKCKTLAGTLKGPDGEQIAFKLWLSDAVPGTIVKQVRTARQKGELIAETTTTLQSYKKAE